ncbi:MAG: manganese efflux pump [Clostridia bacterium]|nr:manganese efflux pump [Clostridia bacterium]
MQVTELILIGIGLAMDAFAVTLSNLFAFKGSNSKIFWLLPVFFGLFQAIMPITGFFAGSIFVEFLTKYAGLVTLLVLGFIGIRTIIDAFKDDSDENPKQKNLTVTLIILQAVTTSIDALMVGVSFCAECVNIWYAALVIGIVTFIIIALAIPLGKKFGNLLGSKAQILGGAILCAIGIKSFLSK